MKKALKFGYAWGSGAARLLEARSIIEGRKTFRRALNENVSNDRLFFGGLFLGLVAADVIGSGFLIWRWTEMLL